MTDGGNATRASSGMGPIFILRQFRLGNGLVLMGYLFTHLANYAFELWSLEVLEAVREIFVDFWCYLTHDDPAVRRNDRAYPRCCSVGDDARAYEEYLLAGKPSAWAWPFGALI